MRQTEKFAGDFANTSDSLANQQRILTASWEDAQAAIGEGLVPVLEALLPTINRIVQAIPGFVNTFETGIQTINRTVNQTIDLLSPFSDRWSDAEEAMYQFQITSEAANGRLQDGIGVYQVAGEWMINLAREGALTAETMRMIEEDIGATTEEMAHGRDIAEQYGGQLGLTEQQVEDLAAVTKEYADQAARDAIAAEEELAESARDLAFDTMEAARAQGELEKETRSVAQALLDASDPVYGAINAMDNLATTLDRIDEDGERTNEELLELARVTLEAQAAMDQVDSSSIESTVAALSSALGISAWRARELLAELGILDGQNPQFTITGNWNIPPPPEGFLPGPIQIVTGGGQIGMHTGGIVGGPLGTDEVLRKLQKGEGVIDRDTMQSGIGVTGGGSTVVYVTVEGSVIAERELATSIGREITQQQERGVVI